MFDKNNSVNRKGTGCSKWDLPIQTYKDSEIIGMGIADTDFKVPQPLLESLENIVKHGAMGYTYPDDSHLDSIRQFYLKNGNFQFQNEAINFASGVISLVCSAILSFSDEGDEVIIQSPTYAPLMEAITDNSRIPLISPFKYNKNTGRYDCDFENIESKITSRTKIWLLCNPHNPTGKFFTREELQQINSLAKKHNLIVISDEINGFLNFKKAKYHPFGSISEDATLRSVTLSSASKLFGTGGIIYSFSIIPNPHLHDIFKKTLKRLGTLASNKNIMGLASLEATFGGKNDKWRLQKMEHIEDNYNYLKDFLSKNIPEITLTQSSGTFVTWLNFRGFGLTETEVETKLIQQAKVFLVKGSQHFYGDVDGFFRMNIACSKATLKEALSRIEATF